jgi:hypothetical protein
LDKEKTVKIKVSVRSTYEKDEFYEYSDAPEGLSDDELQKWLQNQVDQELGKDVKNSDEDPHWECSFYAAYTVDEATDKKTELLEWDE